MTIALRQLRALTVAVESGSFGRAAARLNLSQPALTVQIRTLEAALGLTLFDRSARGAKPTEAGRALARSFARVLAELDEVVGAAREQAARRSGTVLLAVLPSVAASLLPEALALLRRQHPGIRVLVRDGVARRVADQVKAGEAELGIGTLAGPEAELEVEALFADDLVAVLLRRGAFDASAAQATARTLRCYSLGLFFHAYAFINGSFFAALGLGVALFHMGIVTLFLNFAFNWLFLRLLHQPEALALSTTATMTIIALLFLKMLTRRLGRGALSGLAGELFLIVCATATATAACYPLHTLAGAHALSPWLTLVPLSLLYAAILLAVLIRFKTGEIAKAVTFCQNALHRRRRSP